MASWRPQQREPDLLHAAINDYLRDRAPQVYLDGNASVRPLGRSDIPFAGDQTLAIDLSITPVDATTRGNRSVIVFKVSGHVADASTGYQITGNIELDKKTLAFLSIDVRPTVVNSRK